MKPIDFVLAALAVFAIWYVFTPPIWLRPTFKTDMPLVHCHAQGGHVVDGKCVRRHK